MSSLVGAIFGSNDKPQKEETTSIASNLSNLFDRTSSGAPLPQRPRHDDLPARTANATNSKRKQTSTNDGTEDFTVNDESIVKKRKKPRKTNKELEESKQDEEENKIAEADRTETDAAAAAASSNRNDNQYKDDNNAVEERTIFVGNLPLDTTRRSLASHFKSCGRVESARLRSVAAAGVKLPPERAGDQNLVRKVCANTHRLDDATKKCAQGYVVFAEKASVEEALKLNNTTKEGHRLRVDRATPTMDASRSVFVGNLPYHAEETSLHNHFVKTVGLEETDVEGIRIVRDRDTMQCKGFGYVLFANKTMVATALRKSHGSKYMKRELRVTVCGKRFKGRRRGDKQDAKYNKKRTFEGNRASAEAVVTGAAKRILGKKMAIKSAVDVASTKKRRARGQIRKTVPGDAKSRVRKAGVSKRAAAEAKVGKRIKKIQKRVARGMGKARTPR